VAISNLALEKSQSEQVRKFAERTGQDHTAANQRLMSVEDASGRTVPKEMDQKHQAILEQLSQLSGTWLLPQRLRPVEWRTPPVSATSLRRQYGRWRREDRNGCAEPMQPADDQPHQRRLRHGDAGAGEATPYASADITDCRPLCATPGARAPGRRRDTSTVRW
jgi:Domain of unknown function (DUF4142)